VKDHLLLDRLEKIMMGDLDQTCQNLILKDSNGYQAFGNYSLKKIRDGVVVTKHVVNHKKFLNMRNAVSWCVADKYQQLNLSREIESLDRQCGLLQADISMRSNMLQKLKDADQREIIKIKLSTKQLLLKTISERLDKCVNLAKYWQIRGFNNEIARTRRTTPARTNFSSNRELSRHTDKFQ
jgi:hypothetical protein